MVRPQVNGRSRISTFFRLIFVIPHYILLCILFLLFLPIQLIGWLIAIVLGRLPTAIHNLLVGYTRYNTRVTYYMALIVDDYPPFSFR